MNIILGTPPWDFQKAYGTSASKKSFLNKKYGLIPGESEPLGLLYITSVLLKNNYNVKIVDGYIYTSENWLREIEKFNPEIVGLSCSSYVWDSAITLSERIKAKFPNIYIAVGGPHVTGLGEGCFSQNNYIDFAIPGEGEITFLELCNCLKDRKLFDNIEGLIFRSGSNIIKNNTRMNIKDLDSIPFPAREMINITEYKPSIGFYNALPSISIMTSRGCPYHCNFCISDADLRLRSIKNIIEEIDECIQKFKTKHVVFWDENITIAKNRIFELCDAILTKDLSISWCGSARVDCLNETVLRLIKKAGCWKLLFGLETGVEKNLKRLNKTTTLEQARLTLSLVRKAGIESFGTFMFGIPEETYEEAVETIKFACSLPLDYAAFLYLCPFPGSDLYNDISKYGTLTGIWATTNISFVPYSMTLEQMQRLAPLAYKEFYLRPSYILRRASKIRSRTDLNRDLRGFLAYFLMHSGDFG